MDFARQLSEEPSVATKSNIRIYPLPDNDVDDNAFHESPELKPSKSPLDRLLLEKSNQAAWEQFLRGLPEEKRETRLADGSLYTARIIPRKETIHYGDLVVIMESFGVLTFAYVEEGSIYNNRNGHFHHADFVGKPFGSKRSLRIKIRSRNNQGYGFIHTLKPTTELWARSLNHRTQIVHELDQSQIIFQLYLRPNMKVVESGTGSGAMSHGILRSIAPHGHLYTYEFNAMRAESARQEFAKNGVSHLVTVHHRDVCATKEEEAGFDLPPNSMDAVFLDLPEPWVAVPHAAKVLKPGSRIASYSPCVEQTQRTVEAMDKAGFHSIKTMEYRLQEHYVDQVKYESPPRAKRPKFVSQQDNDGQVVAGTKEATADEAPNGIDSSEMGDGEADSEGANAPNNDTSATKDGALTVARPFSSMRGHTAFLTFATAAA